MEPPPAPSDRRLLGASTAVLLLVAVVAFAREAAPEWQAMQDRVAEIVTNHLGAERAAAVPRGLQQIWIPELGRVDRCVTCHATIEWGPELADAPLPARSHPRPELLEQHPPETFGCTLCHGGQGAATTREDAHGEAPFWEEPLLSSRVAHRYGLEARDLLETRCNHCHRWQAVVDGMPLLNAAKAEVVKRHCARCHTIDGKGAATAPDLTWEGDKHPSRFGILERSIRPPTALAWQIEHLVDPQRTSPGSGMPKFRLTDELRRAIALLVLSWRRTELPPRWTPGGRAGAR